MEADKRMSDHESRLDQEILHLLSTRPSGALGTLQGDGSPAVSMTHFALDPSSGRIVLHASALAPHTENMRVDPRVSLMVHAPGDDAAAGSRARVTVQAHARFLEPGSPEWQNCRAAYLARFPESESLTALLDYAFVALEARHAHQTSAYGASRTMSGAGLTPLLAPLP